MATCFLHFFKNSREVSNLHKKAGSEFGGALGSEDHRGPYHRSIGGVVHRSIGDKMGQAWRKCGSSLFLNFMAADKHALKKAYPGPGAGVRKLSLEVLIRFLIHTSIF